MSKKIKKLSFWMPVCIIVFMLGLSGCTSYYGQPPYSINYTQPSYAPGYVNVGVSAPTFAFSVGTGVNAYYYPALQTYIYLYNGFYYRWFNGGWVYTQVYTGPWYSVPPAAIIPEPLLYGPPPPVTSYHPYFIWWKANIGPWYRNHYPRWWREHHIFLRNYNSWRVHISPYRAHPGDLYPRGRREVERGNR